MLQGGKYIYCVVEEREPKTFGFSGIDGSAVYLINFRDVAVAVTDVGPSTYEPTRENMLVHTKVLEKLMGDYTVIPMRFGTVCNGNRSIQEMLERSYSDLKDELRRLTDKIELGVRILWDKDAVVKEIESKGEDLEGLRDRAALLPEAEAQDMKLKIGELVVSVLAKWEKRYVREIYEKLKQLSIDSHVDEPIGIKMILNSSFLVAKEKETEFDRTVSELDEKYGDKLKFKYVGPVPPYNFVSFEVEWR